MKTQNFEKMNKIAGDIITLHMCTKNLHHMKHSPEMQNETVSHFGPFFALLPPPSPPLPPNNPESQNFEK